jgi:hypothetical protein
MASPLLAAVAISALQPTDTMYHTKEKNALSYKSHACKRRRGEKRQRWCGLGQERLV